jgi:hypothetical protein
MELIPQFLRNLKSPRKGKPNEITGGEPHDQAIPPAIKKRDSSEKPVSDLISGIRGKKAWGGDVEEDPSVTYSGNLYSQG